MIFELIGSVHPEMIIISACLLGVNCRYDGSNKTNLRLVEFAKRHKCIPICPEQLGGLSTPRNPAKIQIGDGFDVINSQFRVIDIKGKDVTRQFIRGADEALNIAIMVGAENAILKDNSPSCGVNFISDDYGFKKGVGIFTALLINSGIKVSQGDTY